MKISIFDLIDFERINTLLEGFNKTTGFVTAILDLEGRVLSKSGWRNVCVDFHRVNHLTTRNCHTSDTVLASKMASVEKYHFYNCLNGLVDVAVPVVINGEHIANLFSGQFFFEPPNITYFTAQARRYGFDETQYLQRVKEVPVVNAEQVKTAMEFLLNMTELVAQMTVQRLEQLQLNERLQQKQLQLEAQNQQLQLAREKAEKSDQMHSSVLRTSMDGFWLLDTQMNILEVNDAYIKMIGYTKKELLTMKVTDVEAKETPEETREHIQNIVISGFDRFVTKHRRKDGTTFDCEITAMYKPMDEAQIVEFIRDITDRVTAREEIERSEHILRLFVEHTPASIAMFDRQMRYVVASRRYLEDYGLGERESRGRLYYEVFPNIPEEWKSIHQRGLAGEIIRQDKYQYTKPDGTLEWIRWELHPWYESDGQVGGVIIFSEVITEKVEAEMELRESEKYNRMLFEQSVIGLALTTFDGQFVDVNSTFADIIGYSIDETRQLTYWELTPESYLEKEALQLDDLSTKGKYGPYEKEFIHKDGHLVPVKLKGSILERNGQKYIWSGVEDITERKRIEQSLQQSEDRLSKIFHSSPSAIIVNKISDGLFIDLNEAACKIFGYEREELIGHNSLELGIIDREERKKFTMALEDDGLLRNCEVIIHSRQQGDRNALFSVDVLHIDGEQCMLVSLVDITERKRAEEALERSEKEFRTLAESMPQIVWVAEPNGLNIYFNHRWVDYTGLSLEEGSGEGWIKPFHPDDQAMAWKAWKKALAGKSIYSIECRLRRHDGVYRRWLIRGIPVLDDWGIILKWFGTCTDIEEIKEAEDKIKDLLDELRRWHEVTIDREERILELKREVNALQTAKGLPERYGRFSNPIDQE
jgi:PAS domain S-box-containing protein